MNNAKHDYSQLTGLQAKNLAFNGILYTGENANEIAYSFRFHSDYSFENNASCLTISNRYLVSPGVDDNSSLPTGNVLVASQNKDFLSILPLDVVEKTFSIRAPFKYKAAGIVFTGDNFQDIKTLFANHRPGYEVELVAGYALDAQMRPDVKAKLDSTRFSIPDSKTFYCTADKKDYILKTQSCNYDFISESKEPLLHFTQREIGLSGVLEHRNTLFSFNPYRHIKIIAEDYREAQAYYIARDIKLPTCLSYQELLSLVEYL